MISGMNYGNDGFYLHYSNELKIILERVEGVFLQILSDQVDKLHDFKLIDSDVKNILNDSPVLSTLNHDERLLLIDRLITLIDEVNPNALTQACNSLRYTPECHSIAALIGSLVQEQNGYLLYILWSFIICQYPNNK